MSNVHDVLSAISTATQALENEPILKSRISYLESQVNTQASTIQSHELKMADYRKQIEELNDKVRSLEVERDQAGFRVLELEDTVSAVLGSLRTVADRVDQEIHRLDPPKPQPEPEVTPETPVSLPSTADAGTDQSYPVSTTVEQTVTYEPFPSGEPAGTSEVPAAPSPQPAEPNYSGRLYYNFPTYVSRWNWNDHGGTDETYDWRPGMTLPNGVTSPTA